MNNTFNILVQLNSKLFDYYHKAKTSGENKAFAQLSGEYIESFPCRISLELKNDFESHANKFSLFNKQLQLLVGKFLRMLERKFELEELPGKLQNWYTLSFKEFVSELVKKKVKLTLAQEAEWEDYFNAEQTKAVTIKKKIENTDKEIDQLVYALYELTEEEVKIVEG